MDAREYVLNLLKWEWDGYYLQLSWDDRTFLRTALVRLRHGDSTAWDDFIKRLESSSPLARSVCRFLAHHGIVCPYGFWDWWADEEISAEMSLGAMPVEVDEFRENDAMALLDCLSNTQQLERIKDKRPVRLRAGNSAIMYVEYKGGELTGPARICRVTFSQTRKTLYYKDHIFRSLKGMGYKANYLDHQAGGWYWISNCRSDGQDTLYPGIIEVDDDVREEYWATIRQRPDLKQLSSFRSEGKYSRRRPQPEKPNHHATGPR